MEILHQVPPPPKAPILSPCLMLVVLGAPPWGESKIVFTSPKSVLPVWRGDAWICMGVSCNWQGGGGETSPAEGDSTEPGSLNPPWRNSLAFKMLPKWPILRLIDWSFPEGLVIYCAKALTLNICKAVLRRAIFDFYWNSQFKLVWMGTILVNHSIFPDLVWSKCLQMYEVKILAKQWRNEFVSLLSGIVIAFWPQNTSVYTRRLFLEPQALHMDETTFSKLIRSVQVFSFWEMWTKWWKLSNQSIK